MQIAIYHALHNFVRYEVWFFDFHHLFCFMKLLWASVLLECEMPNSCVYHIASHFAHMSAFSASKFKAHVYSGFEEEEEKKKAALAL